MKNNIDFKDKTQSCVNHATFQTRVIIMKNNIDFKDKTQSCVNHATFEKEENELKK